MKVAFLILVTAFAAMQTPAVAKDEVRREGRSVNRSGCRILTFDECFARHLSKMAESPRWQVTGAVKGTGYPFAAKFLSLERCLKDGAQFICI